MPNLSITNEVGETIEFSSYLLIQYDNSTTHLSVGLLKDLLDKNVYEHLDFKTYNIQQETPNK